MRLVLEALEWGNSLGDPWAASVALIGARPKNARAPSPFTPRRRIARGRRPALIDF